MNELEVNKGLIEKVVEARSMTVICEHYNDYNQYGGYFYMITDRSIKDMEAEGWKFDRQIPYTVDQTWFTAHEVKLGKEHEWEYENLLELQKDNK